MYMYSKLVIVDRPRVHKPVEVDKSNYRELRALSNSVPDAWVTVASSVKTTLQNGS